ncbi:coenzyme Q-binding protein COQ10 homolog, mitochondrial [Sinocyclocheilus anshuiensis]|uniref:Coenzyme Q-binding protein COQ10 homolog, mitochondrial n=1 Tax=Sinocyclocheilus anshuiensis TaxID=1608454 RepID=A0A671T3Z9_9TELE|nr:PREDICTED: coenzyme Q-binding protein COQ10 homolog, mitochondrial [Sinocyclocheilus anshuiensis]
MAKKATSLFLRALEMSERQSCDVMRRNSNCTIRHLSSCGILATRPVSLPPPSASSQMVPTRSFINLSAPLIARRMEYSERRSIAYSPEQMYNIVANVDQYQQFVPWCKRSKVTKGRNGDMRAQLEIGFPPFVERYTSEVTVIPSHQVRAVCTDGTLFNHLETLWRFTPGAAGQAESCNVEFFVSFEFKSLLHSQLATVFFDEVVKQMVNAFETRATKLYATGVHRQKTSFRRATHC